MKIFAIGDLHLSLGEGVDKPMDRVGPVWINHDETLKNNWITNISDDDMTVIAGDISWALTSDEAVKDLEWLHELPGKKILIKGNHDLWWTGITRLNMMFDDMYFLQNTCFMTGKTMTAFSNLLKITIGNWSLCRYQTVQKIH